MASSSSSGGSNASDVSWTEKYRPIDFKDFVGNEDAISRLEAIASSDFRDTDMPNLILSGPSGTGKTCSVLAFAHKIFGVNYKEFVFEVDASDERGIDVVIDEIRMFGQKNLRIGYGRYRIVILDKADSMTHEAQQILSRIMEIYSHSTRFALICDTSSDMVNIIEPIQSRCTRVQFSRLSDQGVLCHLMRVMIEEKVPFVPEGVEVIVYIANGDMGVALSILQATHSEFPSVNRETVFEVFQKIIPSLNVESVTSDVNSDDACLASRNSLTVGAAEVEKHTSQKREGDQCVNTRDKRLCSANSPGSAFVRDIACWNQVTGILLCNLSRECPSIPREQWPREAHDGLSFSYFVLRVIGILGGQFRKERDEANERAAEIVTENEELEGIIMDWKARFADVEIKRKEAKKRLKIVEEEKAELLEKVGRLEQALAEEPPEPRPPHQLSDDLA